MDILRCRAVCRSWRGLASAPDFLLAHHRCQPSLPLVTAFTSTDAGLPFLERGRSRSVLGFDDYYTSFKLHASCDGLLVLSRSDGRFNICNPVMRQCAPLPALTAAGRRHINIVALYLHVPSGEYRVLYQIGKHFNGRHYVEETNCYILTVEWRGSPRCIGVPSNIPEMEKAMVAGDQMPVVFGSCLHWAPGWLRCDGVVVFDMLGESFRTMRLPAGATSCFCTRLCDMEGSIGFSCFDDMIGSSVRIWVLEDYEREVWSFKYHVKFHVERSCHLQTMQQQHIILSHKGDVLVYSRAACYMYHCDNTGKLLEEFRWEPESHGLGIIGHMFKESLVDHEFFSRRGAAWGVGQPDYFERL